jgi:hypothetical protein
MSEIPESIIANKTPPTMPSEMASIMDNFNKKNLSNTNTNGIANRQNLLNSSINSTSVSKSSQQVSVRKFVKFFDLTPLFHYFHRDYYASKNGSTLIRDQ